MPFITTAAILGGTALAGAAISSHAAGKAANTQAKAAESAAQLQKDEADKALAFQQKEWETQQQNEAPFLQAGQTAIGELANLDPFAAPTAAEAAATPGYQFTRDQGIDAINKNSAATGTLMSGNTGVALEKYATGLADSTYNDVYNRALGTYNTNENRLLSLAGIGSGTAANLGQQGSQAANNVSNTYLTTGAQQGADIQNAAAARASGYVGGANAWNSALGTVGNDAMLYALMQHGMYS